MWFVCISGVTSALLKMPSPIDMLLLIVVPSEIGLLIAVMKLELGACVRCLSRQPVNSHCCSLTFDLPSLYC